MVWAAWVVVVVVAWVPLKPLCTTVLPLPLVISTMVECLRLQVLLEEDLHRWILILSPALTIQVLL